MKKIMLFLLLYCSITSLQAQQKTNIPPKSIDTLQTPPTDTLRKKLMATYSQQQSGSAPNIIPPSPQSQIFDKYVNHAITEYNGLPDISIPLYEIEMNGLKIPIILSYHASGIKYKQFDGDVGAGWSINAGGHRITRTVHGQSDFDFPFFNKQKLLDYEKNINENPNKFWRDMYLKSIIVLKNSSPSIDSEYDEFTYNTPSTNGNFLIADRLKNTIALADGKLDKISINKQEGSLIDDNGFLYKFGKGRFGENYTEKTLYGIGFYVTSWPLTQITSPYNQSVFFEYKKYETQDARMPNETTGFTITPASLHQPYNYTACPFDCYPETSHEYISYSVKNQFTVTASYLNKIEGINEDVFFNRTDRDMNNTPCLINEVVIKDKNGNIIRKISFNYGISPTLVDTNNNNLPWHILLRSITIGDAKGVEKTYHFDYYTPPSNLTAYPDRWGHYAFSNNIPTKLEDKLFLYDDIGEFLYAYYAHDDGRGGYITYLPKKIKDHPNPYIVNEIDIVNFKSFSLKKISYPTGGYTEYDYEPNNSKDGEYSGGQRVKEIRSYTNANALPLTSSFEYRKPSGVSLSSLQYYTLRYANFTNHYSFMNRGVNPRFPCWMVNNSENRTYSRTPLGDLSAASQSYYGEVSVYQKGGNKAENGKTVSTYAGTGNYDFFTHYYYASAHYLGHKPILYERKIYNDKDELLQEEMHNYKREITGGYDGIKVFQENSTSFDNTPSERPVGSWGDGTSKDWNYAYRYFSVYYNYIDYHVATYKDLLSSKTTTLKTANGDVVSREDYAYDSKYRLIKTSQTNSTGGLLSKDFTYPAAGSALDSKNMVSTVIEQIVKNNNVEIERIRTNYPTASGYLPLPQSVQKSHTGAGGYFTALTYDKYDNRGNLLQYTGRDGVPVSFAWGYNRQYPVAKVVGAAFQEIKTALGESYDELTDIQSLTGDGLKNKLNQIRTHLNTAGKAPLNAQVSTYTYKPLIGMESETDPNGITSTYEYDAFGRLIRILDNEGKVLKQFEYNYKK